MTLTPTPGSVYQFQHLSAGDFEIGSTALDNIVAYDEGEGEAPLPNPADFAAIMGGDSGFLQLWARPEIGSYADLRGKLLAVDAIRTGFTFVLRRMLQAARRRAGRVRSGPGREHRRAPGADAARDRLRRRRCSRRRPTSPRGPPDSSCSTLRPT